MRKIVGFILFALFSITAQAQTAAVIFQGTSNKPFQVSINHIKQHQDFKTNIKVNHLRGNMAYNVKIDFENDTIIIKKNIYLIDDGLAHIYNVSKKAIQLKKVVPAASYPKSKDQLIVNFIINNELPIDTASKDSTIKDTTYIVPFATYYKLEDYEGRIGCPFPIKADELGELRAAILTENLEESKLEKVKIAIQDMDSACVLVDQTKELIVLFEFEETRLDFAKFMFTYTFDIDNYEKLYTAFNFEDSKDQLRELLKKD
ncbi:MAG: DUF4476 domain-containing protein [Flavobacteriales bacterium]|nr:DUF4476 domain-containing protein [Flavobacteriales bacterium]